MINALFIRSYFSLLVLFLSLIENKNVMSREGGRVFLYKQTTVKRWCQQDQQ